MSGSRNPTTAYRPVAAPKGLKTLGDPHAPDDFVPNAFAPRTSSSDETDLSPVPPTLTPLPEPTPTAPLPEEPPADPRDFSGPPTPDHHDIVPPAPDHHDIVPPAPDHHDIVPPAPDHHDIVPPAPDHDDIVPPAPNDHDVAAVKSMSDEIAAAIATARATKTPSGATKMAAVTASGAVLGGATALPSDPGSPGRRSDPTKSKPPRRVRAATARIERKKARADKKRGSRLVFLLTLVSMVGAVVGALYADIVP